MKRNNVGATATQWKYGGRINASVPPPVSIRRPSVSDTAQTSYLVLFDEAIERKFDHLEEKIDSLKANPPGCMAIHRLLKYNLSTPLWIIVEPDDNGIIARCADLPLYGYGDDATEAINNLKFEIDSLYDDLMEDDNFTEDWLKIKSFLQNKVIA